MDNPGVVDGHCGPDDLTKEGPRHVLLEVALLGDVVEQVGHGVRALHDQDEAVRAFVVVKESDDAFDSVDLVKKSNLQRNILPVHLFQAEKYQF